MPTLTACVGDSGGVHKKTAKFQKQIEALDLRCEKLQAIEPIQHALKHEAAIKKLRTVRPHCRSPGAARCGRTHLLRTDQDLAILDNTVGDPGRPQKMERIQAELDDLEADSTEWFCEGDKRLAKLKKAAEKAAAKTIQAQAAANAGWSTVGGKKKKK